MAHSSQSSIQPIRAENDQEHDSSASAASVAVKLIAYARRILELDNLQTEYSAQYLVDNVRPKKEDGQGGMDLKLTVKDCLEFALKEGIPKADSWPHLGCVFKPPPSYKPALVSMKGQVVEAKTLKEAFKLLKKQPVGAKLHVFSPAIDLVEDDGLYDGPAGNSHYVGLRDVIITGVGEMEGKTYAEVSMGATNKYVKVDISIMFMEIPNDGGYEVNEATSKPTGLLVDFCVPRFSVE